MKLIIVLCTLAVFIWHRASPATRLNRFAAPLCCGFTRQNRFRRRRAFTSHASRSCVRNRTPTTPNRERVQNARPQQQMSAGSSSLAYKLLWRGAEKFGSLVSNGGSSSSSSSSSSRVSALNDEEESGDDAPRTHANANDDDDSEDGGGGASTTRRVHTTLTSDSESDADVELVKAAADKVKARRGAPKFDHMVLCGKRGLPMLHDEMRRVKFRGGVGAEAADLHLLVRKYKEWCFAMFPSMPFEPLVDKITALSGNKIVQNFVSRMHENLERGLSVQELALGVERSHEAYVPSDDEDQLEVLGARRVDGGDDQGDAENQGALSNKNAPLSVSSGAKVASTVGAKVVARARDVDEYDEEDYDELLRMADDMDGQAPAGAAYATSNTSTTSSTARPPPATPVTTSALRTQPPPAATPVPPMASQTMKTSSAIKANPFATKTPAANPFASSAANPFGAGAAKFKAPVK